MKEQNQSTFIFEVKKVGRMSPKRLPALPEGAEGLGLLSN